MVTVNGGLTRVAVLKVVNKSGKTRKQIGAKISDMFLVKIGKRHGFLKVVAVNRSGNTGKQQFRKILTTKS